MSSATKKIRIDSHLFWEASEAAARAGYSSVREFVEHAIQKRIEDVGDGTDAGMDAEEKQSVEERLRGLGYIS